MLKIPHQALLAFARQDGWTEARKALPALLREQVDERWKPLLTTVGDLAADADVFKVPLFDGSSEQSATALDWNWGLKAGAQGLVEMDVLNAAEREQHKIQDVPGQMVVRYSASGQLSAALTGAPVVRSTLFGVQASASGSAVVDWFIASDTGPTLAEAAARAMHEGSFVAPMDLPAQLALAGRSRFWGTGTRLQGELKVDASLKAEAAASGWSVGLAGEAAQIGVTLGVQGSASLALKGVFELQVRPERKGDIWGLRVTMSRLNSSASQLGLALSAGADFSALTRSAERFLLARLPAGTPVDALLTRITQPATQARARLEQTLAQALRNKPELLQWARLSLGLDPGSKQALATQLAQALAGPLTDRLDGLSSGLAAARAQAQQQLREGLTRTLGLLAPLSDDLVAELDATVTTLLDKVEGELNTPLTELAARLDQKTLAAAQKLLEPFAALGEHIAAALQATLGAAGQRIDQATATQAVRDGLARYGRLREQITKALGDAQRAKFTASLAVSASTRESTETLFQGWFCEVQDLAAARRLFRALWSGHLSGCIELIRAAQDSGALHDVSGWLLRSFEQVRQASLTVSLLGYSFTDQRVQSVGLELRSDTAGNLVALSGTADVKHAVSNRWISRETQLGVTLSLRDPQQPRTGAALELAGSFTAGGRDMDGRYLQRLRLSLAALTGMPQALDLRRLLETPDTLLMDERKFWRALRFVLPLSVPDGQWRYLAARSDDEIRRISLEGALPVMDRALDGQSGFSASETPSGSVLRAGHQRNPQDSMAGAVAALAGFPGAVSLTNLWTYSSRLEALGFGAISHSNPHAAPNRRMAEIWRLARVIDGIAGLAHSSRSLQAVLDASSGLDEQTLFFRIRPHLQDINRQLKPMAVASPTFTAKGDAAVPWPLVSFAVALARLCQPAHAPDDAPAFIPLAVLEGREDRPVPLLPQF